MPRATPSGHASSTLAAPGLAGALGLALFVSALGALARALSFGSLGLSDAEALIIAYGSSLQVSYHELPGLIGRFAALLDPHGAPPPARVHTLTNLLATLTPWLGALAARAGGAGWGRSLSVALGLALVPAVGVGLAWLSPESLLVPLWLGVLASALLAARSPAHGWRALLGTLGCWILLGLACLTRLSAVWLAVGVLAAWLSRPLRSRWRGPAPWLGLALFFIVVAPLLLEQLRAGWPLLRPLAPSAGWRAQAESAVRFLGAQLLSLTPPLLLMAGLVAPPLRRESRAGRHGEASVLWLTFLVPAVALTLGGLVVPDAPAAWLPPTLLPLAVAAARAPENLLPPRLLRGGLAVGALTLAALMTWLGTDFGSAWAAQPQWSRLDPAVELRAWGPAQRALRDAVDRARLETRREPIVVGAHPRVCAQAVAALGRGARVGCATRGDDDFERWTPRRQWLEAPVLLLVTDSRFDARALQASLTGRRAVPAGRVLIERGGKGVRSVELLRLELERAVGRREPPLRPEPPPPR